MSSLVRGTRDNDLFDAREGRVCEVTHRYWYNGEGWLALIDAVTGEEFQSPDVFWADHPDEGCASCGTEDTGRFRDGDAVCVDCRARFAHDDALQKGE